MGNFIGYARVSTNDQEIQLQLDALKKAGCSEKFIFMDKMSGSRIERPGLDACLRALHSCRLATRQAWSLNDSFSYIDRKFVETKYFF